MSDLFTAIKNYPAILALAAGTTVVPVILLLCFVTFPLSLIVALACLAASVGAWIYAILNLRSVLTRLEGSVIKCSKAVYSGTDETLSPATALRTEQLLIKQLEAIRRRDIARYNSETMRSHQQQEFIKKWAYDAAVRLMNLRNQRAAIENMDSCLVIEKETSALARSLEELSGFLGGTSPPEAFSFNISVFDLYKFVSDCVVRNSSLLKSKKIGLRRSVARVKVKSDAEILCFIFDSMLVRAVEKTPEGGTIGLYCKEQDNHVLLCVEDSGDSSSPERISEVFAKEAAGEANQLHYALEYASLMGLSLTAAAIHGTATKLTLTLEKYIS